MVKHLSIKGKTVLRPMLMQYYFSKQRDIGFEVYYLLVNFSEHGIVQNRISARQQICEKLGITRNNYDVILMRLKRNGFVISEGKELMFPEGLNIDWDNPPTRMVIETER